MVERLYLLTALGAVLVAGIDALLYRRGIVRVMRIRRNLVRTLPMLFFAALLGMVALGCGAGVVVLTSGCGSMFALVHRYWYNVTRDHHPCFITNAIGIDRSHMAVAQWLGYHESYGGHVAYVVEALNALVMAVTLSLIN